MYINGRDLITIIVIVLAFGLVYLVGFNSRKSDEAARTQQNTIIAPQDSDVALTISYNGSVFNPSQSTVAPNDLIRIYNRSPQNLQFTSDNPELTVGEIKPGENKTFFISQKGTWEYRNALKTNETGTIIVN